MAVHTLRLLLVDDHEQFLSGAMAWLAGLPGLERVGPARNAREAYEVVERTAPEIVLLDLALPDENGFDVAHGIRDRSPSTRVIALTVSDDEVTRARAAAHDLDGFLSKADFAASLPSLLHALFPGWGAQTAGEVLQRERDQTQRLMMSAPTLLWTLAPDGTTMFANPAVSRLLGWPAVELVGRNWWRTFFPGDAFGQVERLFTHHALGPITNHELSFTTRTGETRVLSCSIVPRRNRQGDLVEIIGVGADVTERTRVQEVLGRLADGLSGVTGEAYFQFLVRSLTETLGVSHAFVSRFAPGRTDRMRTIAAYGDGRRIESFEYDIAGTPCEDVVQRRTCCHPRGVQGRFPGHVWLAEVGAECYLGTPLLDEHGGVLGILCVVDRKPLAQENLATALFRIFASRAVSEFERLDALQALERREAQFRGLIEHAQDVIAQLDAAGRITYVSPSVERILGYSPGDHALAPIVDFVHADDRASVESCLAATGAPGRTGPVLVRVRHRDGSWRRLEAIGSSFMGPDGALVRVLNARDVTEREQLEATLRHARRMESIGRLAAGIAHDFNNMLTAILGFGEVARLRLPEHHPLQTELGEIARAGARATTLTRQLLAFARRQVLRPQALDVNLVLRELVVMLGRLIGEHIELVVTPSATPAIAAVDPGQLEQVLTNLVVNARDAMPGGGRLEIDVAETTLEPRRAEALGLSAGPYVTLAVRDSGCGMTPETMQRLFEPFFTTKPPGQGTGLGLATAYGIVRQSAGAIEVESEAGAGSTFRVHLPLVSLVPASPAPPRPEPPPAGDGRVVLVVEDDPSTLACVRRTLETAGYRARFAERPEAALALASDGGIDLVLTDMVMPGMNAHEFVARLRQLQPGVRALYMSGYPAGTEGEHPGAPPEAFLAKPFDPNALLHAVGDALRSN